MPRTRVIPCLLLDRRGLWKTRRFADPLYIGDPLNTARLFNDKEVDELVLLDIGATRDEHPLTLDIVEDIAGECFMPLCYGGGVRRIDDFQELFARGVEKVAVNTAAVEDPSLVEHAASRFGSQSVVVSIDVRDEAGRRGVVTHGGRRAVPLDPVAHARSVESMGAGEILLTAVDREGTGTGYDLDLVASVAAAVGIPVVANGGAGSFADLVAAADAGASAVAAGTLFTLYGPYRAVLVTYPPERERVARLR